MDLLKLRKIVDAIEEVFGVFNTVDNIEETSNGIVVTVEGIFTDENRENFAEAMLPDYHCDVEYNHLNISTNITVSG